MHIICPYCTTSYAVDPANFPEGGRKVRCARCHEVWLAQPQELVSEAAPRGQTEQPHRDTGYESGDDGWGEALNEQTPHIESPSISADWPETEATPAAAEADPYWSSLAQQETLPETRKGRSFGLKKFGGKLPPVLKITRLGKAPSSAVSLPVVCMAMGAMVFALIAWRGDMVRAMPQTDAFYKMIGLGVNLRGIAFDDLKISTETVNNKPVLLIEGSLVDVARKSVDIPRLRFIVRDAKGADIYAWNAVLEQPIINPGEKAWFKTRLASPPAEGREIAVRFFHKSDVASGGT
ncbi:MAG: hypothetical protein BGN84_05705 [Afipia sp. 62-7]|nr:zinc-ribbon domain-containing protein [Afipia sp.]OJU15067.1 MAG: hypothetical protein BGN84_05705 [Afipia sp. 62-7]